MAQLMNKGKPDLFDELIFRRAEDFDVLIKKNVSYGRASGISKKLPFS